MIKEASALAAASLLAIAGVAGMAGAAGKGQGSGGGGGGSAIWVDESSYRTDGVLNYTDTVAMGYTSNYVDATNGTGPWLQLHCYKDGALVLADARAGFAGGYRYGEPFVLGPTRSWTAGAADCTAVIGHKSKSGKFVVDASTDFDVVP